MTQVNVIHISDYKRVRVTDIEYPHPVSINQFHRFK
jgi:hypothetical protein